MDNPVICCMGYNRPDSMKRLLKSIGDAFFNDDNIMLVISIDESARSDEVEAVAKEFEWQHGEKIIKRYPKRLGLKAHCLLCGDLSIQHGSVVILEDDVVVAPGFYQFIKEAVRFYRNDDKVIGISLYAQKWVSDMNRNFVPATKGYDTFYLQRDVSHGQCWFGDKWLRFKKWFIEQGDISNKYDNRVPPCVYRWSSETSWSKYISFFMVENDLYYVCPYYSYATNLSELGVHANRTTDICQVPLSEGNKDLFAFGTYNNTVIYDAIFERKDRFVNSIGGISIDDICIDINGMKYDWSGFRYLLSSKRLPYDSITSFGANMEPIENNIIFKVPGDAVHLYKVPSDYKADSNPTHVISVEQNPDVMGHELNKYPAKVLLRNLMRRMKAKIIK